MNKNLYTPPCVETEDISVESGIAMSQVMIDQASLFEEIIVTEETVAW